MCADFDFFRRNQCVLRAQGRLRRNLLGRLVVGGVVVGKIFDLAFGMHKVCVEGLEVAFDKLRRGNSCADVHNAVQSVIDRYG
jgi:hypothetical protein